MKYKEFLKILNENSDAKYKKTNEKIIKTNKKMIGVRMPILHSLAKKISKKDYELFLKEVKDEYYECVLTEALVISYLADINEIFDKLDNFYYKIDNWAVCDSLASNLKIINKNLDITYSYVKRLLKSTNVWKVRFGFVLLLDYYVDEKYLFDIFKLIDSDKNDFYYVMMAKAWLISACYIKYPNETYEYLNKKNIDKITYNKAISKICDSYRVSLEDKIKLKKMKKN